MLYKHLKRLIIVAVVHIIIGLFFLHKINTGYYEEKYIIASGEVTNYLSEEYSCGKNHNSTCIKYIIYLNSIPYQVEKKVFDTLVLGLNLDLYQRRDNLPYYVIYFGCSTFFGFAFLLFGPMMITMSSIDDD